MKRRYITDESYAVLMMGIGVGIVIAALVFGIKDSLSLISNLALLCISLGSSLLSIVEHRKRLGLEPERKPDASLSKSR